MSGFIEFFFFRLHTFHHSIASSLAPLSAYITRGVGCCCSCSWSEPDNLPYTQHTRPQPLYGMICTHGGVSTMQNFGHNNITTTTTGVWAKWWRARKFVQLSAWCFALACRRAPLNNCYRMSRVHIGTNFMSGEVLAWKIEIETEMLLCGECIKLIECCVNRTRKTVCTLFRSLADPAGDTIVWPLLLWSGQVHRCCAFVLCHRNGSSSAVVESRWSLNWKIAFNATANCVKIVLSERDLSFVWCFFYLTHRDDSMHSRIPFIFHHNNSTMHPLLPHLHICCMSLFVSQHFSACLTEKLFSFTAEVSVATFVLYWAGCWSTWCVDMQKCTAQQRPLLPFILWVAKKKLWTKSLFYPRE